MAKAKTAKLIGAHRLLIDSLRFLRTHLKVIAKVTALAAAVNILIDLGLSSEAVGLYQSIWFVIISCATIWTIRHAEDKQTTVSLTRAYYTGTAPALKFFLTLILVALATLPFSIGAFVYSVVTAVAAGSSVVEQVLAGGLWLALGFASLLLLARIAFALLIVTLPDIRPLQSLRISWQVVKGKANFVVSRLAILFFYIGVVSILVIVGTSFLPLSITIGNAFISVLGSMIALPLAYIYLFKLYKTVK